MKTSARTTGWASTPNRDAIAAQGLAGVVDALEARGVAHKVEQTGGGCLAVVATYDDSSTDALTSEGPDGPFFVATYEGGAWEDGGDAVASVAVETVTDAVKEFIRTT